MLCVECHCYNQSYPNRNKPTMMSNFLVHKRYHVHTSLFVVT
jgi:hypothetical protein